MATRRTAPPPHRRPVLAATEPPQNLLEWFVDDWVDVVNFVDPFPPDQPRQRKTHRFEAMVLASRRAILKARAAWIDEQLSLGSRPDPFPPATRPKWRPESHAARWGR